MDASQWICFLNGAITMAYFLAGLCFLRFWTRTHDRFFAFFALAFWVMMVERLLLAVVDPSSEFRPFVYLVRFSGFLVIIAAVIYKNRSRE